MKCATCDQEVCSHLGNDAVKDYSFKMPVEVEPARKVTAPASVPVSPEGVPYVPAQPRVFDAPVGTGKVQIREHYGLKGDPGRDSTVPGPKGEPGKDADEAKIIAELKKHVSIELDTFRKDLREIVTEELADRHGPAGKSIRGEQGLPGKDADISAVLAACSSDVDKNLREFRADTLNVIRETTLAEVKKIPVPRDGKDGSIEEATVAAKKFVQKEIANFQLGLRELIVDILKDRKVLDADGKAVPGPIGGQGDPGKAGPPGNIIAALNNCEQMVKKLLAEFRVQFLAEIKKEKV